MSGHTGVGPACLPACQDYIFLLEKNGAPTTEVVVNRSACLLAFYSNDSSLNPAEVYTFCSVKLG